MQGALADRPAKILAGQIEVDPRPGLFLARRGMPARHGAARRCGPGPSDHPATAASASRREPACCDFRHGDSHKFRCEPAGDCVRSSAIRPRFVDVAHASGIDFTFYNDAVPDRLFLPEVMGGGAAWIDYDGDGWRDLFIANGCRLKDPDPQQTEHISRLYRNLGDGRFVDVSLPSFGWHNGFGQGCAVGDYDSDGFPDLFLGSYGPDVLFHNNGDGTFSRVTAAAGTSDDVWTSSAAWFDADGDGDLDLYAVNYLDVTWANHQTVNYGGIVGYPGPGEYQGVPDRLYVNQGDGTFRDQLDEYGMAAPDGKGLVIAIVDFDEDLRPEIYVGNDMTANFLFTRGDSPLAKPYGRPTAAPFRRSRHGRRMCGRAGRGSTKPPWASPAPTLTATRCRLVPVPLLQLQEHAVPQPRTVELCGRQLSLAGRRHQPADAGVRYRAPGLRPGRGS